MQTNFQAVLFDLDGTLADTLADIAGAVEHALATLGLPGHPLDRYRTFVGDGARTLILRALPAHRAELVDDALQLMRDHYHQHCFDETRLYDGVLETVIGLRRHGLRLAVCSNKPDEFTHRMVAHYFPDSTFDIVRGQLPGVPLKPDPTAPQAIAKKLAIPPDRFLYLGDTNTDMQTAIAAKMYPVGVLWGFRDRQELLENGAADFLSHPREIFRLCGIEDASITGPSAL